MPKSWLFSQEKGLKTFSFSIMWLSRCTKSTAISWTMSTEQYIENSDSKCNTGARTRLHENEENHLVYEKQKDLHIRKQNFLFFKENKKLWFLIWESESMIHSEKRSTTWYLFMINIVFPALWFCSFCSKPN